MGRDGQEQLLGTYIINLTTLYISLSSPGTLKIIDRKKHIFKLSQGEYLAPEKIENVYIRCNLVAQIMVYGNSLKSSAVAIIVPEEEQVMLWAEKTGMAGESKFTTTSLLTMMHPSKSSIIRLIGYLVTRNST